MEILSYLGKHVTLVDLFNGKSAYGYLSEDAHVWKVLAACTYEGMPMTFEESQAYLPNLRAAFYAKDVERVEIIDDTPHIYVQYFS